MCVGPSLENLNATPLKKERGILSANHDELIDMDLAVGSPLHGLEKPRAKSPLSQGAGPSFAFDPTVDLFEQAGSSCLETSSTAREELDLRWYNVCVTSSEKKWSLRGLANRQGFCQTKRREILKNVSGSVATGQLLAVMGPSGAGKTTLLNLLAGRLASSENCEFSGRILVNGSKRDASSFKKYSAYVMQDDDMFADLSVREHISFSARLRLPSSMSRAEIDDRVDTVIRELGLSKVENAKIGNQFIRGVSGGERKRVSIGVELVTNPLLIFLDEPTSGLDAYNALSVMVSLRKLARHGRTVVSTIHQPRSNIHSLFDMLLLLASSRAMYFGPASDAIHYFKELGFKCPENYNPADYYIDIMSSDARSKETEARCASRVHFLAHQQELASRSASLCKTIVLNLDSDLLAPDAESNQRSWPFQFYALTVRNYKLVFRERRANGARLFQSVIFGTLLGMLWYQIGHKYEKAYLPEDIKTNVEALLGVLFFITVMVGFSSTFAVVFDYPLEKSVVLRERASGTYTVAPYFFAKLLSEVPRNMVFNLVLSLLLYFMIGLKLAPGCFVVFWVILCIISMITETMTLCVSTLTPDAQSSAAITPILVVLSLLFAGFFIKETAMPRYIAWCRYLSFLKYGFAAIAINQFEGNRMGEFVLESEHLTSLTLTENIGILFLNVLVWRAFLYVLIRLSGASFTRGL